MLKHVKELEKMEDNSENIYFTILIDWYAARPDTLDDMSLAEFAANYSYVRGRGDKDEQADDTLPIDTPDEEHLGKQSTHIHLKYGLGTMHKQSREAIICFHKFNREKEAEKLYRSKLMLYMPWRNEATDIIAGYATYRSHYEDNVEAILAQYRKNASINGDAMDDLNKHGPPQHAWNIVAPGAAEQQARDRDEGVKVEREIYRSRGLGCQHQSGRTTAQCPNSSEVYFGNKYRDLLSPEVYCAAIRGLNTKQRQVVMHHRSWCKCVVTALKTAQTVVPHRLFVSGPEGVGKSHVISLIRNDTVKLLRLSGHIQPSDVIVLLTAPTGVAAFNIQGMTLHSDYPRQAEHPAYQAFKLATANSQVTPAAERI